MPVKKGQVAKSQDLNTAILLIVAFSVLAFSASSISQTIQSFMQDSFIYAPNLPITPSSADRLLLDALMTMFKILAPLLSVIFIFALAIGFFLGRSFIYGTSTNTTTKKIKPYHRLY
jgi:flagellar biosynthetic protein FlhB